MEGRKVTLYSVSPRAREQIRPYGSQMSGISKEMIEQARKQVLCLHMFAHHEWTQEQDFVVEDDGCSHTYTLLLCDCGAYEIATYKFESHE